AHDLECSRVDPGNVGVRVARRVFHGDSFHASQHVGDPSFELLPAEINRLVPWKVVEHAALDPVYELPRAAFGRNGIEEPSRRKPLGIEVENASSEQVASTEVGEQPAVDAEVAERFLDRV